MAKSLKVPVTIHEEAMEEKILHRVQIYLDEIAFILREIYSQSETEIAVKIRGMRDFILEELDNPFILHDSPFEQASRWMGHEGFHTPEVKEAYKRFEELCRTPEYLERFRHGWRGLFGMYGKAEE